ncbi:MAG TPA: GNAT family N-acetyltransferase [Mycobacteriales bacterium]|nr:GNAT family N-acetyltransferase [Mycobacteriales bacterium]
MSVHRPFPAEPGQTVTLRVETSAGPIGVVGVLVEVDDRTWSVRRRDGSVSVVERSTIVAGRVVPPGRAARASVEEVERIAALGWRALEVARLGEWLARAGGGFTGRANSALAVGDPGRPVADAVDAVEAWYAGHGLPARIQLPGPEAAPAGLVAELDRRGWATSPDVLVMTAELGHVLRAVTGSTDLELRIDEAPDHAWLAAYRQDAGALPDVARRILTNHPAACFASYRVDGQAVAIARAAVDDRWAGLFAVEVEPAYRRHGLGALASAAALRWAGEHGSRRAYLQVAGDNSGAIALYERLGFGVHHHYHYRYASEPPDDLIESSATNC